MTRSLTVLLVALAGVACSPKRLPGTDIRETQDSKAIYDVVQEYVRAMNARDAAAVLAQVAPDYFDDAGTPEPGDDLDRQGLERALAEDLARVDSTRLALTLRKIETQDDTAFAEVFYESYYRVQTASGPVARRDADVHRVRLKRVEGAWKIAGGL
jgi:ketosteroid isomerase-like protein